VERLVVTGGSLTRKPKRFLRSLFVDLPSQINEYLRPTLNVLIPLHNDNIPPIGVGSRVVAPLDFHTWYKFSIDRGLIVLFFGLFCYFLVFFSVGLSGRGLIVLFSVFITLAPSLKNFLPMPLIPPLFFANLISLLLKN